MKRASLASAVVLLVAFTVAVAIMHAEPRPVQARLQLPELRQPASGFALKDGKGHLVRLSHFRGRVVLVDFWATACGGCVQEIPTFVEIANAYQGRGLQTMGVSEDIVYENLKGPEDAWARVTPFIREYRVPYLIVMGDERELKTYDIQALPLTYLVDRTGRVAAVYSGIVDRANIEANVQALLAEDRK
jgi:peroxiredoxin